MRILHCHPSVLLPSLASQKLPLHALTSAVCSTDEMRDLPLAKLGSALPSISGSVTPLPTMYPCGAAVA